MDGESWETSGVEGDGGSQRILIVSRGKGELHSNPCIQNLRLLSIRTSIRQLLSTSSTSTTPLFFARVFHPEFNIDVNEAEDIGQRFERHVKAIEIGGGVRNVETAVQKHRETLRGELPRLFLSPNLES